MAVKKILNSCCDNFIELDGFTFQWISTQLLFLRERSRVGEDTKRFSYGKYENPWQTSSEAVHSVSVII